MELALEVILFFLLSLVIGLFTLSKLIKLALKNSIVAEDKNKSSRPKVFHIGGIAIITSFFLVSMLSIAMFVFSVNGISIDITKSMAIVLTALSLAFLGLVDDIFDIPQWVKALLPMFASIPLIALSVAGSTTVMIPFIGSINLGYFYLFIIIPFAVSGSANLSNIFAGINGLESLLSIIMYATALFFGIYYGKPHLTLFSTIMLGSLVSFYWFNRYPSKVFPGDVGTLVMGGTLASLAIVDNLESFVPILFVPHLIDLVIKLKNRLPSKGWWFEEKRGYLLPPEKPISLLQYTVKIIGKIKEKELVSFYAIIELLLAMFSIFLLIVV